MSENANKQTNKEEDDDDGKQVQNTKYFHVIRSSLL